MAPSLEPPQDGMWIQLLINGILERLTCFESRRVRGRDLNRLTSARITSLTRRSRFCGESSKPAKETLPPLASAPVIALIAASMRDRQTLERSASAAMASIKSFLFTLFPRVV